MTETIETPGNEIKFGIHRDLPDSRYHKLKYCSKHALDVIMEFSPYHLKYQRENPKKPTDAFIIGSALHCKLLTPDRFEKDFPISTQCSASTGKGTACRNIGNRLVNGNWFCGTHAKDYPETPALSYEDNQAIDAMISRIKSNNAAASILDDAGPDDSNEVAAVFEWPELFNGNPLKCKAKADGIRKSWSAIFDVKTTTNASRQAFEKEVGTYGYYRQAAFYLEAFRACGLDFEHFVIIAVEKTPPYGVACYRIMGEALELGREELKKPMALYAACERNNNWPGYETEFQDITIPSWKFRQVIQQL